MAMMEANGRLDEFLTSAQNFEKDQADMNRRYPSKATGAMKQTIVDDQDFYKNKKQSVNANRSQLDEGKSPHKFILPHFFDCFYF